MKREKISELLKNHIDPSLTLGDELGKGATGEVYDIKGYSCDAIVKVIDVEEILKELLKDFGSVVREDAYVNYYQKLLKSIREEVDFLKKLQECDGVTRLIAAYELEIPGKCFFIFQEKYQELDMFISTQHLTQGILIQMTSDILKTLIILEKKQILHRDIKPANIFIKWECGAPRFVLGDFGLARTVLFKDGQVTICGTPAFMAPELMRGKIHGYNSDIFSLGASLFYIMTQGDLPQRFHMQNKTPCIEQGSKELQDIILKAIKWDPQDRYQHPSEMLQALQRISNTEYTTPIIYNRYVSLAKQAILDGNLLKAQLIAVKGCDSCGSEKEAIACFRIYMYIKMKVRNDYDQFPKNEVEHLKKIADRGDAMAQYLYGLYLFDTRREMDGIAYMHQSAENGCEIGGYVYGRMLCQGFVKPPVNIAADRAHGTKYLEHAALKGYIPAIRYLKRLKEQHLDYVPDREIQSLLQTEILHYDELKQMYMIPFL